LARLASELKASDASIRLNIEIMRHGTFKPFEEHLQRRLGYFHVVHFDLHGAVQTEHGLSQLSQFIIWDNGEMVDGWTYNDSDKVDLVVGLLQGVPAVVCELLPLTRLLNIPWKDLYDKLHRGRLHSLVGVDYLDCELETDIGSLFECLPVQCHAPVLILTVYWLQGRMVGLIVCSDILAQLPTNKTSVLNYLSIARDRGFIVRF
jgi:hypothetical protein